VQDEKHSEPRNSIEPGTQIDKSDEQCQKVVVSKQESFDSDANVISTRELHDENNSAPRI
jgi:hypothetical protein